MAVGNLTPALIKKAMEELNEIPQTRDNDIQALRKLVLAETNLLSRTDDAFLIRFLRARKFDCSAAFKLLQRYYLQQQEYAAFYIDFRASTMRNVFEDRGQPMLLPDRDQLGRTVYIWQPGKWNPDACSVDDYYRSLALCLEAMIEDEEAQINGFVIINDLENFGANHVKHLMPNVVYKFITLMQESFPFNLKGIHVIKESAVFDALFTVFRPFLSEQMKVLIIYHGWNLDSLHDHVTPDILPEEFGGRKPPVNNAEFYQSLITHDDQFLQITRCGYQSIQNFGGQKTEENVIGNSYKKLDFD